MVTIFHTLWATIQWVSLTNLLQRFMLEVAVKFLPYPSRKLIKMCWASFGNCSCSSKCWAQPNGWVAVEHRVNEPRSFVSVFSLSRIFNWFLEQTCVNVNFNLICCWKSWFCCQIGHLSSKWKHCTKNIFFERSLEDYLVEYHCFSWWFEQIPFTHNWLIISDHPRRFWMKIFSWNLLFKSEHLLSFFSKIKISAVFCKNLFKSLPKKCNRLKRGRFFEA